MRLTISTLIIIAIVVIIFVVMWRAWRKRTMRDTAVLPVTEVTTTPLVSLSRVFYVATTVEGEPLERIAIPGLKYRGYCDVDVHSEGLVVTVAGESPVVIPAKQVTEVTTGQMRIDKVVERGGLLIVKWQDGERTLETSFRPRDPAEQLQLEQAIQEHLIGQEA